jgi:hypothetical protein
MKQQSTRQFQTLCAAVALLVTAAAGRSQAQPVCAAAKLTISSGDYATCPAAGGNCPLLPFNTAISWSPASCTMVVQGYQNGTLSAEYGTTAGVASGTIFLDQLTRGKQGETQVKIWAPGSAAPADAQFVWAGGEFADTFETDKGWGYTEELVGSCYVNNAGLAARSPQVAYSGQFSLLTEANRSRTTSSNHLIGNLRLSRFGRGGRWRYCTRAFIDPATQTTGQTGPEVSLQNTRLAANAYLTHTAGIQYLANPFLTGTDRNGWNLWIADTAGNAVWQHVLTQKLDAGVWYSICLEADFDQNRYGQLHIAGGGLNLWLDLSAYTMAAEKKFTEEAFWLTLEDENLYSCSAPAVYTYRVFYDNVTLTRAPSVASQFVPVTPCRIADTRDAAGTFGGPAIPGGSGRSFPVPQSACGIPATALGYALNVTVVPRSPLGYLTLSPSGQARPFVSTLNSPGGKIVANAALVPAGAAGAIDVFATDTTDVVLDINGYFAAPGTAGSLAFYPLAPCRVADTRSATSPLGGPSLSGGSIRAIPVVSSACGVPLTALAYSLNATAVPKGPLGFLSLWPAGQVRPNVSTLNSPDGSIVANAAFVPAGSQGAISAYATDNADLVLDINGYFAAPGNGGGLSFYPATPCRAADTREPAGAFGGPILESGASRSFSVAAGDCAIPTAAQALSLNATVVPGVALGYLTLWPTGGSQPFVSTLNSPLGSIVANAAIVPNGANGAVSAFATDRTHLILDINGYFAP